VNAPPPPPDSSAAALPVGPPLTEPDLETPLRVTRARGRLRGTIALLGPAFVAAVAYIDPGNFATNITAGAQYGYLLVWVILAANLMAMLVQYLSAKIGIASERNLPELCRESMPRSVTFGLWIRPRWWPPPPTSPSSSARQSHSTCCSACRCSPRGS
jgi:manganese transport protein